MVVSGETDAHGYRSFDPVHAQAFEQAFPDALLAVDFQKRADDCGALVTGHCCGLHTSAYDVQRVGGGLPQHTGNRAKY